MANPTPLPRSRRDNRKGMGIECDQIIVDGKAVLAGQMANVTCAADADAAAVRTALRALLAELEDTGAMASAV